MCALGGLASNSQVPFVELDSASSSAIFPLHPQHPVVFSASFYIDKQQLFLPRRRRDFHPTTAQIPCDRFSLSARSALSFRHTSVFVSTTMFRAAAAGPFDEVVSEYPANSWEKHRKGSRVVFLFFFVILALLCALANARRSQGD